MDGVPAYPAKEARLYRKLHLWKDITLGEALDYMAKVYPGKEAVVDDQKRWTFSELSQLTTDFASALADMGFRPGDKIMMQMPNQVEWALLYLGMQKIGVVPIPCNPRHSNKEIENFGKITEASAWIGPPSHRKFDYLEMLKEIRPKLPSLKQVILVEQSDSERPGTLSLNRVLAQYRNSNISRLKKYTLDPDEPLHLLPTGGTTGMPKLVPRTHNSYICAAYFAGTICGQSAHNIDAISTPMAHNASLVRLMLMVLYGSTLAMGSSTLAKDMLAFIQKERATGVFLVPTLIADILNEPDFDKYDVSCLRYIPTGGAKGNAERLREAKRRLKCSIHNSFGMSEGPHLGLPWYEDEDQILTTVGKPFCPWDDFRLLDENGKEVPRGEEGLLAARGATIFKGYYRAEETNHLSFTPEGYFMTGDLARVNEKGNFIITGRMKDVINRGGEKISAPEVEELVMGIEGVVAAAAVPMPDVRMGEKVCVFIKPVTGYRFNLETVCTTLRSRGASVLLLPERIEIIEEMPLTPVNKIDKKVLIQRVAEMIKARS